MTHANTTVKTKAFTALYSTNGDFYLTTNATQYEVKCRVSVLQELYMTKSISPDDFIPSTPHQKEGRSCDFRSIIIYKIHYHMELEHQTTIFERKENV